MNLLCIIDFETTGFLTKSPNCAVRPVQVGVVAVDADSLLVVDTLNMLLCPDVWAYGYEKAERIHGISRATCELQGLSMGASWEKAVQWEDSLPGAANKNPQFLSWNATFDYGVMARWCRAATGAELPPWTDWHLGPHTAPAGCLMKLWNAWKPDKLGVGGSLDAAMKALDLPTREGHHNALYDAVAAASILQTMHQRSTSPLDAITHRSGYALPKGH